MSLPTGFLTSTLITDLFTVENQLADLVHADLFKAYDRDRGRSVGVWICRQQFEPEDERLVTFVKRMGKFSNISIRTPKLFSVGLDPSGLLFIVIEYLDGFPIVQGNIDVKEAERRFVATLQIVETLHAHGVALGDLGENSFWLTRTGDVSLVGVMGDPSSILSNEELLKKDVLSIIAICKKLFGTLLPSAPAWITETIAAVESTTSKPIASATSLASLFRSIKERVITEHSQVSERGERRLEKRSTDNQLEVFDKNNANKEGAATVKNSGIPAHLRKILIGGVILGVVILTAVAVLLLLPKKQQVSNDAPQDVIRSIANDRTKQVLDVLNSQDTKITEKRAQFAELAKSDDPVAHTILVNAAVKSIDPAERLLAEHEIINRAKRFDLGITADVVKVWLDSIDLSANPPEYKLSLELLDGSLPPAARGELSERLFVVNPSLGSKLLATLVLSTKEDIYRPSVVAVISKLSDSTIQPPPSISSNALVGILLENSPELQTQFDAVIARCNAEEIRWFFLTRMKSNKKIPLAVINRVINEKIFGDRTAVYVHPLLIDDEIPDGFLMLIYRILNKEYSKGDIEQLGIWLHQDSLEMLKALLLDINDEKLRQDVVDYVSGRSSGDTFSTNLFGAIHHLDESTRIAFAPIAGLATSAIIEGTPSELETICKPLLTIPRDSLIFSALVGSPNQGFLTYYLEKFDTFIPGPAMISVLSNSSVSVRKAAVHALRNVNNTAVLQVVLEAYEAEKDPEVKKAYVDELWVIRERVAKP